MALLEILEIPHPGLRAVAKPVADVTDDTRRIVSDMLETMYDAHGIGLAATQVAIEQRILVIDLQEPESDAEDAKPVRRPHVFINPEYLWLSDETASYNEGCLSHSRAICRGGTPRRMPRQMARRDRRGA